MFSEECVTPYDFTFVFKILNLNCVMDFRGSLKVKEGTETSLCRVTEGYPL